jgi:putative ABC transport system substrate-binding protein
MARLLIWALCASFAWRVSAAEVLTLIPDVREPYRSVLNQIVNGIRTAADTRLVEVPATAGSTENPVKLADERVVIALGNSAVQVALATSTRLPVVTGAIVSPTGEPPLPGVSLETDPTALFRQLHALRPGIRRVFWLYRPERSGWLLQDARTAASNLGLELVSRPVDTARDAIRGYQELLDSADSQTDALWLSQDPALVNDDSTLPDILSLAWTHNTVVFSGSLQHVANGVLFALVPDNGAMGQELARVALAKAKGKSVGFIPNRGLRRAINRRTAEHLGIAVDARDYDFVLPAR